MTNLTPEDLATLTAGGRIWTVTLTTEQKLITTVIATNDADKETLTELALRKADCGDAVWTTTAANTKARWL